MIIDELREELFRLRDAQYGDFQAKLLPTIDRETIIGVRTPDLRSFAKRVLKREDAAQFLEALPHRYFDENQLHAFMLSEIKDYEDCLDGVNRFLPFIDNWATCDQLSPKVFKRHRQELLSSIKAWLSSDHTYTIRFAVGMLMAHYMDEDFDPAYLETVSKLRSGEYYVNMMIAWYFATALTKQYPSALLYIENRRLDAWVHNKAIQKAVESYRIPQAHKDYLKTLRIPARQGMRGHPSEN